MLNLLEKFESIKIENNNRISAEDKEFCEIEQEQYREAYTIYNQMIEQFCSLTGISKDTKKYYDVKSSNSYLNVSLLKNLKETIENLKDGFISAIVYHFVKKYNVTIDSKPIKDKYDNSITYDNIIDDIFEQLGGMTFNEKANNEIKESMKNLVNSWREVEIKGKKIKINSFFYIDSFDKKWGHDRVSYSSSGNFDILLTALSNFEYGITSNSLSNLYNKIRNKEGEQVFTVHELIFDKVNYLKLFKNGKIEIEFTNSQYAEQFTKEYCNFKKVA